MGLDDLQTAASFVSGMAVLALVIEFVRACVWAGVFYFVLRKLQR